MHWRKQPAHSARGRGWCATGWATAHPRAPWLWAAGPFYRLVVVAQTAAYACAAAGWLLKGTRPGRFKGFTVPMYFVLVNAASLLALWNVLRGKRIVTWQTGRSAAPAAETPRGVLAGFEQIVNHAP